jgi:hypothetical protein
LKDGRPAAVLDGRDSRRHVHQSGRRRLHGSAEAIERWKVWLAKGYTSNIEAQQAK